MQYLLEIIGKTEGKKRRYRVIRQSNYFILGLKPREQRE